MHAARFAHAALASCERLLEDMARLHMALAARSPGALGRCSEPLQRVAAHLEQHQGAAAHQEAAALLGQLAAVLHGRDPDSGQRLMSPARETQFVLADALLRRAGECLRRHAQPLQQRLDEAREQLGHALLAAVQGGVLTPQELLADPSTDGARRLWSQLVAHVQFMLLDRRLRIHLHPVDITLVLESLLQSWRSEVAAAGAMPAPVAACRPA